MIARLWRGQATTSGNADAYAQHFSHTVTASLKTMAGHRGAWLLRRDADGQTEFLAMTLWESRQAIEAFTGPDIRKAIVEPEGRPPLPAFAYFAPHYQGAFKS